MKIEQLLREKRDEIQRIAAKHGARNVRVFGSVARGEAGADSDIDILVDLEPGTSLLDLGGLLMDLQELLKCKVDIAIARSLKQRIKDQVLKQAIPL